jgi:hypothetical protein
MSTIVGVLDYPPDTQRVLLGEHCAPRNHQEFAQCLGSKRQESRPICLAILEAGRAIAESPDEIRVSLVANESH